MLRNDLMLAPNLPRKPSTRRRQEWKPAFSSQTFVRTNKGITTEQFRLSDKQLKKLGVLVSKRRANFRTEAEKAVRV